MLSVLQARRDEHDAGKERKQAGGDAETGEEDDDLQRKTSQPALRPVH